MSDWEPGQKASRAAWKDRYDSRQFLEREQDRRERHDQALRDYRGEDHCNHGRSRKVGKNDMSLWAARECKAGKCPILYLTAAEVFAEWRNGDSHPDGNISDVPSKDHRAPRDCPPGESPDGAGA